MRMELTKSVLGEEFLVSNFPANIARPGSRSMALHSNQSMMLPEPWLDVWAVNVKWCLTRMTKENGATLYISGSNKWTRWEDVFCECSGPADPQSDRGRGPRDPLYIPICSLHTAAGYWSAKLPKGLQGSLSAEVRELLGLSHIGFHVYGDPRYMAVKSPKELEREWSSTTNHGPASRFSAQSQALDPYHRAFSQCTVNNEELDSTEQELEKYIKDKAEDEGFFKGLVPQETLLIGGFVGKADTLARICEHPILRTSALKGMIMLTTISTTYSRGA
ncbi:MAG: hypothetical protein LQ346_004865 [Caloplaca aetnensis]|nr:MAG: hypothetical protein LQ346_004865 [Caloplaca aetnensis]